MSETFVNAYSLIKKVTDSSDKPLEQSADYMSAKALNDFSIKLVEYRIENKLSQTGLAKELGISQPMVSQYETGTNNLTIKRVCEICEKINLQVAIEYKDNNDSTQSEDK